MTFADLLAKFAEVREERDGYVVPCPSHEDGRPSLRIALQEDGTVTLHCRAACPKGAVLDAFEEKLGVRRRDLFDVEPGEGVEVRRGSRTDSPLSPGDVAGLRSYVMECAEAFWDFDDPVAAEARAYVADRFGLTEDAAEAFHLGLDHGGRRHAFEHRSNTYAAVPRLVVPFADPDAPDIFTGAQGRALRDHRVRWCGLSNPEGSAWAPTAAFFHTGRDFVLITEGPSDALTVVAGGYDAVAVAGASRTSDDVVDGLTEALRNRTIVVVGDGDPAGHLFTGSLSQSLADAGLRVLVLDLPGGDINDWRNERPDTFVDDLHAAVRKARRVSPSEEVPEAPDDPDEEGPALTDLGNAERLLDALGGPSGVRYSPEVGFFRWNGQVWETDRHDSVRGAAQAVTKAMKDEARQMLREAGKLPDSPRKDALEERGKRLIGWAKASQSSRALDAMPKELRTLPGVAVDIEQMDAHEHLLTFANGTVDLRSGTLLDHDPGLLLTKRIPFDFDPDASAPRWRRFLTEVFPEDPDLPGFVQRLVGYGITGSTDEQCFAVLWGHGANGKSVFTDTLTEVFRAISQTTPFSTFEERPSGGIPNDIAALRGARLVMASEGDRNRKMAEAVIKRVTGNDLVSARFMRREFFEFRPSFLIFLATNHKPQFRGQDEGLWRRVKLIPWVRYFAPDERDPRLGHHLLREEAEGIIAWAVEGAVDWYAHGLDDPSSVIKATESYRETSDALSGFFPGVLERERGAEVLGADAYHHYVEWAEEEGLPQREQWTRRTFYGAMEERGIDRKKTMRGQTLIDVRLAEPAETPEPEVGRTHEDPSTNPSGKSLDDVDF